MTGTTLTFVIPAYNAAATLGATLDSLIAQSRADWAAIVVDDGSTDATCKLARRYASRDPRIRVLQSPANGGVCRARNLGLAAVESEWVAFLDSDDWVAPTYCERMLARAADGADVVYCGYRRIAGDEQIVDSFNPDLEREGFALLARLCAVAIHCVVVRSALAAAAHGFDPALDTCEDWDLWQRIARAGARFVGVPESLALYRAREGSLSRDNARMLRDGLTVLRRGYGPDPRVQHPHPDYAAGLGHDWRDARIACFAAWCAAAEVGAGGDGAALLAATPVPDPGADFSALAETIVEGLAVGARTPPAHLIERLPALRPELDRLIASFAAIQPRAGAERGLTYAIERALLEALPLGAAAALTLTARYPVRLDAIAAIAPPDGVDLLVLDLIADRDRVGRIETAALGPLQRDDVAELALGHLGLGKFLTASGLRRRPRFWTSAAQRLAVYGAREARRLLRDRRGPRPRALLRAALADAAAGRNSTRYASAALAAKAAKKRKHEARGYAERQSDLGRAAAWEERFADPDPWNYTSGYERQKYDLTLELLGEAPIARALELGCAEGLFTQRLAPRVERLIAADISTTALGRAKARCGPGANIRFLPVDIVTDQLIGEQDVIVCSEMLYYLDSRRQLTAIAAKLRDALAPGGRIVTANHFLLKDDMSRTGFDWDQAYGGKVIFDVFCATAGLAHERSIVTELYRIDVFRRLADGAPAPLPVVRRVALDGPLEPSLTRHIVWGGANRTRRDALDEETSWTVPVLAYHRIADDGPEPLRRWRVTPDAFRAQLRLLRSNGYYSVGAADLAAQRAKGQPFPGRPVLISFDDGYQDFADTAWPILEAEGFSADVFIVTDLVGKTAAWDAAAGPPAPLMSWDAIVALAGRGARFGSHLASHTPAPNLSSRALVAELERSRADLQARIGAPVNTIVAPYGAIDERFRRAAARAGYTVGLSCDHGVADIRGDLAALPRIEVQGEWSLAAFAAALGLPAPDHGDDDDGDLVTVVIPAYNAAATIDETLVSVRAQTHANLEILVVDDGSADATPAIVARHAAEDRRVRLIRQRNGGVAAARNRAIAESRGALIAPVDADDLWAPAKIEKQLAALRRAGPECGLVYTWYAVIDARSIVGSLNHTPKEEGDVLERLCRGNVVGNGSAPLMRKSAVLEAGGYEPGLRAARAQGCEDLLLYFRIAERRRFAVVQEHLTAYRQLTGAMSGDTLQMLRSYRIVAAEMRRKHPQHRAAIRWGQAHIANWLMYKALGARRFGAAAQLAWAMLTADPAFLLSDALPQAARKAKRRLGAMLRARTPAQRSFFEPLPGAPVRA